MKYRLWPHVKKQIKHREVAKKTVFHLIHLIIGLCLKVIVVDWMLRIDGRPEIIDTYRSAVCHISSTVRHFWLNIYQLAHFLTDGFVKVKQVSPSFFKKGTDIILIILKER